MSAYSRVVPRITAVALLALCFSLLSACGVYGVPYTNVPCTDSMYEARFEGVSSGVSAMRNTEIGNLFDLTAGSGKLSIMMWVRMKIDQISFIDLLDVREQHYNDDGNLEYGDRLRLWYNPRAATLAVTVRTNSTGRAHTDASIGLSEIKIPSDQYRSIVLTLDASTGQVSGYINSVKVLQDTFPALQSYGLSMSNGASFAYAVNSNINVATGNHISLGDLSVVRGAVYTYHEVDYLSHFRMPTANAANGCIVSPNVDDMFYPTGDNLYLFYFYSYQGTSAFSLTGTTVYNPYISIRQSPFVLTPRAIRSFTISGKSWSSTDETNKQCGATQSMTVTADANPYGAASIIHVKMALASTPPSGTEFTLSYNGNVMGTYTVTSSDTLITFYATTMADVSMSVSASNSFGDYCVNYLKSVEAGSMLGDPHQIYYEQVSYINVYSVVKQGFQGVLLPLATSCEYAEGKDQNAMDLIPVYTYGAYPAYYQYIIYASTPGAYHLCVYPSGSPEQMYEAGRCASGDTTNTFFCDILLSTMPTSSVALPPGWVTNMLHLGMSYYDGLYGASMSTDYLTKFGGEAYANPTYGDYIVYDSDKYFFYPMSVATGIWARLYSDFGASSLVEYLSVAIYSPNSQSAFMRVLYNTTTRIRVDGVIVFDETTSTSTTSTTDSFQLSAGWHTVLVKVGYRSTDLSTPEFAFSIENAINLRWNYAIQTNATYQCGADARRDLACFGDADSITEAECTTAGCCYDASNSIPCFEPTAGNAWRADGQCGPQYPAVGAGLAVAQCKENSCCGEDNVCSTESDSCTCTTCLDYQYANKIRRKYILWGDGAKCSGAWDLSYGVMSRMACQHQCEASSWCSAYWVGTADAQGNAECYLTFGSCSETIMDDRVSKLYSAISNSCKMTLQESGVTCEEAVLYASNMSSADCLKSCSYGGSCSGAVTTSALDCYFVGDSCNKQDSEGSAYYTYQCIGDDAVPPVPKPATPTVLSTNPEGCFSDDSKTYFAESSYPDYPNNRYHNNYLAMSTSTPFADCRDHCYAAGARYFAITDGNICTCGTFNQNPYPTDSSACDQQCEDSNSCGGSSAASVYSIVQYTGKCQFNYTYFQGYCYRYVADEVSWLAARMACNNDGTTLASIKNSSASQYLMSLVGTSPVWIGAERDSTSSEEAFSWTDATPFNFVDWVDGEPNNGGSWGGEEDCVLVQTGSPTAYSGSWADVDCYLQRGYVCGINPESTGSTVKLAVATALNVDYCVSRESDLGNESMIGWYQLGSNNLIDSTYFDDMSDNNVIVNVKGTTSPIFTSGQTGSSALSFSGSVYLQAAKTYRLSTRVLSVAAWFKTGTATVSNRMIVSKTTDAVVNSANPPYLWGLGFNSNNQLCFFVGVYNACYGYRISPNEWVHAVGVFDSANLILYVNGNRVAGATASTTIQPNSETFLVIGGAYHTPNDNSLNFNGVIDSVRIYNAAVSHYLAQYLSECTPTSATTVPIAIYENVDTVVSVIGGGISTQQYVGLSAYGCYAGGYVTFDAFQLSPSSTGASGGTMTIPASAAVGAGTYLYSLCHVSPRDKSVVAGPLYMQVQVVSLVNFGDVYYKGVAVISKDTSFPYTMDIMGYGLNVNQALFLSMDSTCSTNGAVWLTISDFKTYDGSELVSGTVTIPSLPPAEFMYVCWSSDGTTTSTPVATPFIVNFQDNGDSTIAIAVVDGSTQVTYDSIMDGYTVSSSNYFKSCDDFSGMDDMFYLAVTMGDFTDYLIPPKGATVCDLLTASSWSANHRYTPTSPKSLYYDGSAKDVTAFSAFGSYGGSADGLVLSEGRSSLSFWGDEYYDTRRGGCCFAKSGDQSSWYRQYRISVGSIDDTLYYFEFQQPMVVAEGSDAYVEGTLRNVRGWSYPSSVDYTVTIGSTSTQTVTARNGRLRALLPLGDYKSGDFLSISVTIPDSVEVQNGNDFSVQLTVSDALPTSATLIDSSKNISQMLHFGGLNQEVPSTVSDTQDYDWFAYDGGEDQLTPEEGDTNTAYNGMGSSTQATWTSVSQTSDNGYFSMPVTQESVGFSSFGLYVGGGQTVTFHTFTNGWCKVAVDGETAVSVYRRDNVIVRASGSIYLSEGWHQVFIKQHLFDSDAFFAMRVDGSALGFALSIPTKLPQGTYLLFDEQPMMNVFHLGTQLTDFFYGSFNDQFIGDVSTVKPVRGLVTNGKPWMSRGSENGNWPINGDNATTGQFAVSYIAFALFSTEDTSTDWSVGCAGSAQVFFNGRMVYECSSDSTDTEQPFSYYMEYGWYQIIMKYGAAQGSTWFFSITPVNTHGKIAWRRALGSQLPAGVRSLTSPVTLKSLNVLMTTDSQAPIPNYDDSERADWFSNFDIPSTVNPYDSVSVMIYQQLQSNFWWSTQYRANSVFGLHSIGMAGDYNQYYSVNLYVTSDSFSELTATILRQNNMMVTFAVWLDGEEYVYDDSYSYASSISLDLKAGWHTLVFKMQAPSEFGYFDDANTTSYGDAAAACQTYGFAQLCPMKAVCPYAMRRAVLTDTDSTWLVPISDTANDYVQLGVDGGEGLSQCQSYNDAFGYTPSWASTNEQVEGRRGYACCGFAGPSTVGLELSYSGSAEAGYSFSRPAYTLVTPTITVDNERSIEQTVTITSPDSSVNIYYSIGGYVTEQDGTLYSGPFVVTEDTYISAMATRGTEKSDTAWLTITIPTDASIGRQACVARVPCSVETSGTAPGLYAAFLSTTRDSELDNFLDLSYARSQQPSSTFSGALLIRQNLRITLSNVAEGSYYFISYNRAGVGKANANGLSVSAVDVTPNSVVGHQKTYLNIGGGVVLRDGVLFPEVLYSSSVTCSRDTCIKTFSDFPDRVNAIQTDKSIMTDFYGYSGTLTCMCLSTAGSSFGTGTAYQADSDALGSVGISVTVVAGSTISDSITYLGTSFPADGENVYIYGNFASTNIMEYNVVFRAYDNSVQGALKARAPTCQVTNVSDVELVCVAYVAVGTYGDWNLTAYHNGVELTNDGADTIVTCIPPSVNVTAASGDCAKSSDKCTTGSSITFIGINFDYINTNAHTVILTNISMPGSPTCDVTAVTSSQLTCVLTVPVLVNRDTYYGVSVVTKLSSSTSIRFDLPDLLRLRAGSAPGWTGEVIGGGSGGDSGNGNSSHGLSDKAKLIIILVTVILGVVIIALVIAGICVYKQYKFVPKRPEEMEMMYMEEQLLRAERESTTSLKRGVDLPPGLPHQEYRINDNEDEEVVNDPVPKPGHPLTEL